MGKGTKVKFPWFEEEVKEKEEEEELELVNPLR